MGVETRGKQKSLWSKPAIARQNPGEQTRRTRVTKWKALPSTIRRVEGKWRTAVMTLGKFQKWELAKKNRKKDRGGKPCDKTIGMTPWLVPPWTEGSNSISA